KSLHQADDAALRSAVVRVKRLAALTGRRCDRNNPPGLLLDHVRHRKMDEGIDTLEVNSNHVVPLLLGHLLDRLVVQIPHAGVGHHDVQSPETRDRMINKFLVVTVAANVGFESLDASSMLAGLL